MTSTTRSAAHHAAARFRVSWWRELALLAALYGVYMLARALVGVHPDAAMDRGRWLLDLEAAVHVDMEQSLNAAVHAVPLLAVLADYIYASLHYILTPVVLVWLAVRHRDGYRRGRNALLFATALGLIGFWPAADRTSAAARRCRVPRHHGGLQRLGLVGRGRQCPARHGGPEQPVRRAAFPARRLGAVVRAAGSRQHQPPPAAPLGMDLPGIDHDRGDGHREPLPARRHRRRRGRPGGTRHRAATALRSPSRRGGRRRRRCRCCRRPECPGPPSTRDEPHASARWRRTPPLRSQRSPM